MSRSTHRLVSRSLAAAFLIALIPGCPPDTCTPGENMTNPRLANGLETVNGTRLIRITWDPGTNAGASLPDAYFAAVSLGEFAGTPIIQSSLIRSVQFTAPNELTVTFQSTFNPASTGTVNFRLFFPDRRGFITCTHPGSGDRYYLDVTLEFTDQGSIQNASFQQDAILGPI